MRVFTCTDHEGHYVGVASVVIARNEDEAREVLSAELRKVGLLSPRGFSLTELDTRVPHAVILQDGDY